MTREFDLAQEYARCRSRLIRVAYALVGTRAEAEDVVGALPERDDPAEQVTLHETVSFAVMVLLETLTPAERTSWALRELFGLPYDEIAEVVGRSPAAVRQLATCARAHIAAGAPRVRVDADQHQQAVAAFTRAATQGDIAALVQVLDPAVVLTSDGGGKVSAARKPVHGQDRVARFLVGVGHQVAPRTGSSRSPSTAAPASRCSVARAHG